MMRDRLLVILMALPLRAFAQPPPDTLAPPPPGGGLTQARSQPSVKRVPTDSSRHSEALLYTSPVSDFTIAPSTPSGGVCDICWAMAGVVETTRLAASSREMTRRGQ